MNIPRAGSFLLATALALLPISGAAQNEEESATSPSADKKAEKGLGVSLSELQSQLKDLDLEVTWEEVPWDEGGKRWMAEKDLVILEAYGETKSDITKYYAAGFFPSDDASKSMISFSAILTPIIISLPAEDRRTVSKWVTDQIDKLAGLKDDATHEASKTHKGRKFEFTFHKTMAMASLSVTRDD